MELASHSDYLKEYSNHENFNFTAGQYNHGSYRKVCKSNENSGATVLEDWGFSECNENFFECEESYRAFDQFNGVESDNDNTRDAFSDGEESYDSMNEDFDLSDRLAECFLECKVPATTADKILAVLHAYHPSLPLTYRSLLKTELKCGNVEMVGSGEYMHYGIMEGLLKHQHCIMNLNTTDVKYHVNIDGLPLYKSSSTQLWPILGRVVETQCMFLIGAFCGTSKPSLIGVYLQKFIEEAKRLSTEGFMMNGKAFTANVMCIISDAPARAYLKQIKGHTGYDGCERCVVKGTYLEGRMTFQSTESVKRNDCDFNLMKYEGHQLDESPLLALNIGLVSACVLDSMHMVYIGITKKLLRTWMRGPKSVRLSAQQISVISDKLVSLRRYIPQEFGRKPRALSEIDRFKASELRQFLLYTGLVALKSVLETKFYNNFLNLSVAMFTLSSPKLVKHYADYSESLLRYFVEECKELYGKEFIVYNVHSVIHIADDAKNYGCLDGISSFPFENYLGHLKTAVRKPQQILQQISKRLSEGYCLSKCSVLSPTVVKREHDSGPVVAGLMHFKQYKQVNTANFVLKVHIPDNCIRFGKDKIGIIRNIFFDGKNISLLLQKFKKTSYVFSEPMLSCDIGIYLLTDLDDSMEICKLDNIYDKMVMFPAKSSDISKTWIGIPLLHSAS